MRSQVVPVKATGTRHEGAQNIIASLDKLEVAKALRRFLTVE
jgi:hypothetical protein